MKRLVLTLIVLATFISKLSAQGDITKGRWIANEMIIDGNANEWVKPLNCYDDKTGLLFAVGNDRDNLYLCFTCEDEMKMRKMMNAGWKIGFISKEKKKKFKTEINFPAVNMAGVGMGIGFRRGTGGEGNGLAIDNPINIYRLNLGMLPVKGFTSNKTEIKLNDWSGINIAIGSDKNQRVIYEIAIPFRELYGDNKIGYDEEITMDVTVNGMERPTSSGGNFNGGMSGMGGGRMGGGMSGMGGRGGGGRMGGGMGGGRMGGGMSRGGGDRGNGSGGLSDIFENASFKQKFTLASNQ